MCIVIHVHAWETYPCKSEFWWNVHVTYKRHVEGDRFLSLFRHSCHCTAIVFEIWCSVSAKNQTYGSTSNFTVVNIGLLTKHPTLQLSTTDYWLNIQLYSCQQRTFISMTWNVRFSSPYLWNMIDHNITLGSTVKILSCQGHPWQRNKWFQVKNFPRFPIVL